MKNNAMKLLPKENSRALKRGDIYYADLSGIEQSLGSEQTGRRPVLIIQNDIGNLFSPTTIVATLTTKIKRNLPTHVLISNFIRLPQTSVVCLEQIKTIDKSRLENYRGNIGNALMEKIGQAIAVSLGTDKSTEYTRNLTDYYTEEEAKKMDLVKKNTDFDGKEINWLQFAEQQLKFFTDIKQYMVNLTISLQNTDNEIEDILDYIESTKCNAAQGYKLYKILRQRRIHRKQLITELHQLETLTESFDCQQMQKQYQSSISKIQHMSDERKRKSVIYELLEQEVG